MKTFKKSDLKTGMKVVIRSGEESIYIENPSKYASYLDIKGAILVGIDGIGFSYLADYDENLNQIDNDSDFSDFDIMKVYAPTPSTALRTFVGQYDETKWELVWEREEQRTNIKYIKGSVLDCPRKSAIAHCISADCDFGLTAQKIDEEYNIKKNIQDFIQCTDPNQIPGLVVPTGIIYSILLTNHTYETVTLESLKVGMSALCYLCTDNGFSMISMQKDDNMFDCFDWDIVVSVINETFKNTDIEINIYVK